jgi:hypothetical protein
MSDFEFQLIVFGFPYFHLIYCTFFGVNRYPQRATAETNPLSFVGPKWVANSSQEF